MTQSEPSIPSSTYNPFSKSHKRRNMAIVVIALVVAVATMSVTVGLMFAPKQQSVSVFSCPVTVKANDISYGDFSVPSGATNPILTGSFTVAGGSGNDIKAYVMSMTEFANFQHGIIGDTYYSSGQVTTGNIDVSLPSGSGRYIVLFDNQFSPLSAKTVSNQITLTYKQ